MVPLGESWGEVIFQTTFSQCRTKQKREMLVPGTWSLGQSRAVDATTAYSLYKSASLTVTLFSGVSCTLLTITPLHPSPFFIFISQMFCYDCQGFNKRTNKSIWTDPKVKDKLVGYFLCQINKIRKIICSLFSELRVNG